MTDNQSELVDILNTLDELKMLGCIFLALYLRSLTTDEEDEVFEKACAIERGWLS